jgi:hypothetical protein
MYGTLKAPQVPYFRSPAGVDTGYGIILPPGGNVIYLRSTGAADSDPPELIGRCVQTLAAALSQCRSGKGDTIVVLPGHSETVADATMMDNLVAGTRIIGVGHGSNRPTFSWSAAASNWAISKADVIIENLYLNMCSTTTVTAGITFTAANPVLRNCEINLSLGDGTGCTTGLVVSNAATGFRIVNNYIRGTATLGVTDVITINGTTVPSNGVIADNYIMSPCSAAAGGLINVKVAAKNLAIAGNRLYNLHSAAVAGIRFGAVAADGIVCDNHIAMTSSCIAGITAGTAGIVTGSTATVRLFQNYVSGTALKSGLLATAATADA